jgi:hypothetical protein
VSAFAEDGIKIKASPDKCISVEDLLEEENITFENTS